MRILDKLKENLRSAAVYNPEVQSAPACILWPDHDRQWEAAVPRLQNEMPELYVLGNYAPEKRIGPGIWLRCVLAEWGNADDSPVSDSSHLPIIYLPGVSRQDLRAVETCPEHLKPIAELQYRGVIWSQVNARDWTLMAFLKSDQGGLGMDVAQDNDTKNAMQLALYHLLGENVALLKEKHLDKVYFNTLLTGGDTVKEVLCWIDQGDAFRAGRSENEWRAFVALCKSQLAYDPENAGVLAGAAKLAGHEGPWSPVWMRFCEAPTLYPNIPNQMRKCKMPPVDLFSDAASHGTWPQWNDAAEGMLRKDLLRLSQFPPHKARAEIASLEKKHGSRRDLVWAAMGQAPLSMAMKPLAVLAEITALALTAGTINDVMDGYSHSGWQADEALISALFLVDRPEDVEAVSKAIVAVYKLWAEESARYLQKRAEESGYPGGTIEDAPMATYQKEECILFSDGLRFDTAKQLSALIRNDGFQVDEKRTWAALPSVTATGKPTVTPVRKKIYGKDANTDFEPDVAETGKSVKGGYHLYKLLNEDGWTVMDAQNTDAIHGRVWCEFGNIDHEGHQKGSKLAKQIPFLLKEIREQVRQLFRAGANRIRIVTDHGWLLLPGGLPKVELPSVLADNKWGRCAVIKPGAVTQERLYPWFWNPHIQFALADGISCFREGLEYSHGGLSLQECLTLELTVTPGQSKSSAVSVEFTDVVWKGMRCTVAVDGDFSELSLDIRKHPGNRDTSVILSVKPLKENGAASVVVEKDELEGSEAVIVLMDSNNELVAQVATIIGGENK